MTDGTIPPGPQCAGFFLFDLRSRQPGLAADAETFPKIVGGLPAKYFWKELIRVGEFTNPITGKVIAADRDRVLRWCKTANDMVLAGIRIPLNQDHELSAGQSLGEVVKFRVEGDRLLGKLQAVGDDAAAIVARNDVSVGILPQWHGYADAIYHVSVCQLPVVTDLSPAIAASALPAAPGAIPLFMSAGSTPMAADAPPEGHFMTILNLNDAQAASLKGHKHLGMDAVADAGLADHIVNWHARHADYLSALKREIPGGESAADGDVLARAAQHMGAMKAVREKLFPGQQASNLSAAAFESKIDELGKAAGQLSDKDNLIKSLQAQAAELSAKSIRDVPAEAIPFITEGLASAKERLINRGFKPFAAQALVDRCLKDGKANATLLSPLANPNGTGRALIFDIVDLIEQGMGGPVAGTLMGVPVPREIPGGNLETNDLTKALMQRMQPDKK